MKKPFFHPTVPAILLKFFMGEMSDIVTKGSRISPDKIINSGFLFTFSNLEEALKEVLENKDKGTTTL
jgi:uncharacterized protein